MGVALIALSSLTTIWVACAGSKPLQTPLPPHVDIDAATLAALRIYHAPIGQQAGTDMVFKVCLTAEGTIERVESLATVQREPARHIAEEIARAWSYQAYVPPGQSKSVAVCGLVASEQCAALDASTRPAGQVEPATDASDMTTTMAPHPAAPNLAAPNLATPAPSFIAPTVAEQLRVAGIKHIAPDNATANLMRRLKVSKVRVVVKMCLAADGTISSTEILSSSGFGNYDRNIFNTIRTTWKYRPLTRDGVGVPVCTTYNFSYAQ